MFLPLLLLKQLKLLFRLHGGNVVPVFTAIAVEAIETKISAASCTPLSLFLPLLLLKQLKHLFSAQDQTPASCFYRYCC